MAKKILQDNTRVLFDKEFDVLKVAKEKLNREQVQKSALYPEYKELVESYEKLLKVTAKIFKISDIQGRVLKNHESHLNKVNENLRQLEESRRQLVSDISHELGTPMTSIQGYLKAMLDNVIEPDRQYLNLIYDKTLLVNQLVEDLFELSKLEANQVSFNFKEVTIQDLMANITRKFALDFKNSGINFMIDPIENLTPDNHIIMNVDPARIDQVMVNLINNAVKYTPTGGTIRIQCQIQNAEKDGEVIIKVIDSGSGIDEKSLPFVFDRFFKGTQSQKVGGTGLGLAIAKQIIIKHGGYIGVDSMVNKGSTFYFSLPISVQHKSY
ncbi:histidine kinase [Desulforamulus reducens MI-1]|uniref:histidine kinase n=1 Tax=Desulforamulus reducens (strain ATCC BAA-1160 / DSM 100696 / MI-1) TaxID=349161 RepID=A4J5L4_DESRM|nr:HAMP domain-containing sensor histidine kinase [Desulforamulus reducens]ABO50367.1 histidine kinase [Desulforamulus reducens MI-1]